MLIFTLKMKKNYSALLLSILVISISVTLNSCSAQKKSMELYNYTIILSPKQTKKVSGTDIILKLESCGRKWDTHGEEWPFCDLYIKDKNADLRLSGLAGPIYIKTFIIKIIAINPWGVEENGIPAGGCKVNITTAPAVALLSKYQQEAIQLIDEDSIDIPKNCCTGLPFTLYAYAAEAIGFKLDSLAGKKLSMQKWKLKNIEKRSGRNYIAIILMDNEGKATTGWLSVPPESGMTPGLYPLNKKLP